MPVLTAILIGMLIMLILVKRKEIYADLKKKLNENHDKPKGFLIWLWNSPVMWGMFLVLLVYAIFN